MRFFFYQSNELTLFVNHRLIFYFSNMIIQKMNIKLILIVLFLVSRDFHKN